jgi:hypothetical protein
MRDYETPSKGVTMPGPMDYQDIPRRMKLEYNFPATGKTYRILDNIVGLLVHFQRQQVDMRELMTDAANLMSKLFSLKQVGIGMRGADGIFRFEALVGYRPETEAATRKLAYTQEQFADSSIYKGTMISKYTKVFLAEDNPWLESEREAFNLPSLLGMTRRSLDDCMEGDYIDTHILGKNGELIGWIELGGTTSGKLPDMAAIRWIEFIGQIIGAAAVVRSRDIARR